MAALLGMGLLAAGPAAAMAERHTVYLEFNGDPTFPEYGEDGVTITPLNAFDASLLNPGWGAAETAFLRNAIINGVRDDYREFDIRVTDVKPNSGFFQTLGIDSRSMGGLYGQANGVDSVANHFDHSRLFAGTYASQAEWQGANATLARFTKALVGTSSHEIGHNYGLSHNFSQPNSAELANGETTANHILSSKSPNPITREQRATIDRHFSDTSYGILGAVLGLKASTMASYGFINTNVLPANDFHIELLSKHSKLTIAWESDQDPFGTPVVTRKSIVPDTAYQGENYYRYDITWATPLFSPVFVQPGQAFKVGIGFNESNDFVVQDTFLTFFGSELPGKPRVVSPGKMKIINDKLAIPIHNGTDLPITIAGLRIKMAARMTDLELMDARNFDNPMSIDGLAVNTLGEMVIPVDFRLEPGQEQVFELGDLQEWIRIRKAWLAGDDTRDPRDAEEGGPDYDETLDFIKDLFPSAYLYGMADVILHDQMVFDPDTGGLVPGDIVSQVFFQNGGLAVTVPEPTSAMIGLLMMGALVRRRTR